MLTAMLKLNLQIQQNALTPTTKLAIATEKEFVQSWVSEILEFVSTYQESGEMGETHCCIHNEFLCTITTSVWTKFQV